MKVEPSVCALAMPASPNLLSVSTRTSLVAARIPDVRASTRAEDDAMMWGVTLVLALLAIGSGVTSIVLFVKKKTIGGVLLLVTALVLGALAAALGALMLIASLAWH